MIDKEQIEDVMYGRTSSRFLELLLFFLSLIYGALVRLRISAYEAGLLRTKKLPCRVISVGNITVGGTGKTPMVMHIAEKLQKFGRHPLVLSRGYGRKGGASTDVVSNGDTLLLGADYGGDEPVLIASRLKTVPVVVGSDRYDAGSYAFKQFHPDCIVLDDGYQHIRLERDLNIALIDAGDPFGKGKLFPAGILREPLTALRRADVVVMTRVDVTADTAQIRETIGRQTTAQIFTARYLPRDLVNTLSGDTMPLVALHGSRIFTFAGIARPGSLDSLLRSLGAIIAGTTPFPDHHTYTDADLEQVLRSAADCKATLVVTTEKDSVRLKGIPTGGIWALRIDLDVLEKEPWEELLRGRP